MAKDARYENIPLRALAARYERRYYFRNGSAMETVMADTLFDRIKGLIKGYDDHPWITDKDAREASNKRWYSLRKALLFAYGEIGQNEFCNPSDSLPKPPEKAISCLFDLSDLSAHERAKLYGLIHQRWDAWCKILGGPAVADAVDTALVQIDAWDLETRRERLHEDVWVVGLKVQRRKPLGRRPLGVKAMSNAERQRRYREHRRAKPVEVTE